MNFFNPVPLVPVDMNLLYMILEQNQTRRVQYMNLFDTVIANYDIIGVYLCTYCGEIIERSGDDDDDDGSASAVVAVNDRDVEEHIYKHFYEPVEHYEEHAEHEEENEEDVENVVINSITTPEERICRTCVPIRIFGTTELLEQHILIHHPDDHYALNRLKQLKRTVYEFIGFDKLVEQKMITNVVEYNEKDICPICCSTYEEGLIKPYMLSCCKAISCDQCLKQHIESKDGKLECMFCRKEH